MSNENQNVQNGSDDESNFTGGSSFLRGIFIGALVQSGAILSYAMAGGQNRGIPGLIGAGIMFGAGALEVCHWLRPNRQPTLYVRKAPSPDP